ncbi:hypothetical protein JCM5353_006722, partial [Sporobolomyces roseus]
VKCDLHQTGCPWSGPFSNLKDHSNQCQYRPQACNKSNQGCQFRGTAAQLVDHFEKDCQFVDLNCPRACGTTYKRAQEKKHEETCFAWKCTVTEGCKTKCTKALLKQHETGCKIQAAQLKKTKTKLKNVKSELRRKRKTEAKRKEKDQQGGIESTPELIPTQPATSAQKKSTDATPASKEKETTAASTSKDQGGIEKQGPSKKMEIENIKIESDGDQSPAKKKRKREKKGKGKSKAGMTA